LRSDSLTGWALLATCAGFFALTAGGHARSIDEQVLVAQTESLLGGSLAIPQTIERGHFYGRISVDGQPYGAYGPGWPALALPFYSFGKLLATWWQLEDRAARALVEVTTSWLNALAAALTVALLWLLLTEAGYDRRRVALPLATAAGVATPLWVYAGSLYTEPVAAAALTAAVWAGVRWARERHPSSLAIAGACLALLPLVDLAHVVLVPVVASAITVLASERTERLRVAAWLLVPALVSVGAHLALNGLLFGDPLTGGVPASWNGKPITLNGAFWVSLFGLLLSPGKGLAVFAPLALAGAAFAGLLWRHHKLLAVLALAPVAALLAIHVAHTRWEGGFCFGPRYLVPALPLALVPLAELLHQLVGARRRALLGAFVALVLASAWVQATGVGTSWFATPRDRDLYYDESSSYRLTYAPLLELNHRVIRGLDQLSREPQPRARLLNHWYIHLGDAGVPFDLRVALGVIGVGGLVLGLSLGRRALVAGRERGP
jgi:hypothetical protein